MLTEFQVIQNQIMKVTFNKIVNYFTKILYKDLNVQSCYNAQHART